MKIRYRFATFIYRVIIYIILFILLAIIVIPIWVMLVNATRSTPQIMQGLAIFPSHYLVDNFRIIMGRGVDLPRGLVNSLYLSTISTSLTIYFGFLTAYGLVVYDFPGKRFMNNFILVLVLIPMQLSIFGYYQYMSNLGLVNTYWPLILPSIAAAGSVFFAKQYLESIVIPDLIDAARMDGAGEVQIYHRIMVPMSLPGIFTMAIFSWVATWNNFITPFVFLNDVDKYTLPMQVQRLQGDVFNREYGASYLGIAFTIAPIMIMYAIFSRYIVNGISMGAIKE